MQNVRREIKNFISWFIFRSSNKFPENKLQKFLQLFGFISIVVTLWIMSRIYELIIIKCHSQNLMFQKVYYSYKKYSAAWKKFRKHSNNLEFLEICKLDMLHFMAVKKQFNYYFFLILDDHRHHSIFFLNCRNFQIKIWACVRESVVIESSKYI